MTITATHLSALLSQILTVADQGEIYDSRVLRDTGEALLFCFYPNRSECASQYIENTLSAPFAETGIHVMVAEDLPHQDGPRADQLRRVRVTSRGRVVFDRVITVGTSHTQLIRWYSGEPAFDCALL